MTGVSSHPRKTGALEQLTSAARAVLADASSPLLPGAGDQVSISRTALDRLQAALAECDARSDGSAWLEIVVIENNTPLLKASAAVPPAEAKPLARILAKAVQKAAVSKRPAGKTIYFSTSKDKKTGFLSDSAPTPIFLKGHLWPTVRHYYLAQKYAGTGLEDRIRLAISPAAVVRGYGPAMRPDWPQVKVEVMREALWAKFAPHKKLRGLLLETGEARLVSHSRDAFWGDGLDGQGKNMLGQLLMDLRTRLRQESPSPPALKAQAA